MSKGKIIGIIIAVIAVVALGLGAFYFLMNRETSTDSSVELTETEELVTMDIEANYPASPRAVVNLYSRFLACLYNESYTDGEFEKLVTQMRLLLDEELLRENPEDEYLTSMESDVSGYKSKNWTISNYTIPETDEVTYKEIDGAQFALLTVGYFIKEDTAYARTYQDFVLRREDAGDWKIYGYSVSSSTDTDENGEGSSNE